MRTDASVVAWGDASYGGDASGVASQLSNVKSVHGNAVAFAALKMDASVVAWGAAGAGGAMDDETTVTIGEGGGVLQLFHTQFACAPPRRVPRACPLSPRRARGARAARLAARLRESTGRASRRARLARRQSRRCSTRGACSRGATPATAAGSRTRSRRG